MAQTQSSIETGSILMMDELSIDSMTNQKVDKSLSSEPHARIMMNTHHNNHHHHHHQQQQRQRQEKQPIEQKQGNKLKMQQPQQKQQLQQQQQRPHFRIDWRQLCYFQKSDSSASKIFRTLSFANPSKNHDDNKVNDCGKGPKQILNSLDGCFKSGQLSAILGPSGAGKSTFLSALFGSKQESAFGQTKVTWFTDPANNQIAKRRSLEIASLPQHDHLLNQLTVYETLMFASKIKNATRQTDNNNNNKNFHRQNVKRVAKMLKLGDCLDTRCGKLSGGQHKRVSIGQELLSEPDVIILDEPTSGLDAMTCLTTIQTLKSIVMKHPICIILTIHQPDIDVFSLFDHVYVIAQGGLAIYEGPPENIMNTLAKVNLKPPSENYNPARFIVENAFAIEPNSQEPFADYLKSTAQIQNKNEHSSEDILTSSDDDDDDDYYDEIESDKISKRSRIKRSVLSLTDAISGKETSSNGRNSSGGGGGGGGCGKKRMDRKPLLNIGIQTLDGKLITSEQLAKDKEQYEQSERWNILKRLNQIQSARYRQHNKNSDNDNDESTFSHFDDLETIGENNNSSTMATITVEQAHGTNESSSSAKSDYSSSGWSDNRKLALDETSGGLHIKQRSSSSTSKLNSLAYIPEPHQNKSPSSQLLLSVQNNNTGRSLQLITSPIQMDNDDSISISSSSSSSSEVEFVSVVELPESEFGCTIRTPISDESTTTSPMVAMSTTTNNNNQALKRQTNNSKATIKLKRQFDKRLSAKHNCSKRAYPVLYHGYLLTHRTWLSIIRDPIFFGIQACMHTIIPIILALIFGSEQDEGCPRLGNFDLVDFAYSDSDNMIQDTVSSIRKSISNVGIVFLEMFVLSFSINCITALVFPLDMYVLLKEYRNGWYALRSYFFGRTLADLPIPIVLHSLGMAILYFLTGQPASWWRFGGTVVLVILTSMVAQSIGLTIGALLMRSSQSAVLAAAGVVAPFFALSGFIVRIHTLPLLAQLVAKTSYLYQVLNGFIILRYGFGRCTCRQEDFVQNLSHQIPNNLHTLASMWIGTYSEEYQNSVVMKQQASSTNRTNVDPNIDVVDKMLSAFKMASSFGHKVQACDDALPYPMLDFDLRDQDIYKFFLSLVVMLIISRCITFSAIYYKIRSVT